MHEHLLSHSVREQLAAALGYDTPEAVDMHLTFLELGIDSLVATEFRNRLHTVTGLRLPANLLFEISTPAELVEYVEAQVELVSNGHGGPEPQEVSDDSGDEATGPASDPLTPLFLTSQRLERVRDGIALLQAAARLRPVFSARAASDQDMPLVSLARGEAAPALFCWPSIVATGGPHEYVRLAKAFRDKREIFAVPLPGYGPGEELPDSLETVIATHVQAIRPHLSGGPIVFAGHSTGGLLAHATAARFAQEGLDVALVLIDTYRPSAIGRLLPIVCERMAVSDPGRPPLNDDRLTAMGAYLRLLEEEWEASEIEVPTLLVKASEPVPGLARDSDWRSDWQPAHSTLVTVSANHFTIIEDSVEQTAEAIDAWVQSALTAV